MNSSVTELLRSSALFRSFNPSVIADLVPHARLLELRDGEPLVSQGELDRDLYIVLSGNLNIVGNQKGGERGLLFQAGPGQTVREMAVFSDDSVSASIISNGPSCVLALARQAFEDLSARHPLEALDVMESLSASLEKSRLALMLRQMQPFGALDSEAFSDLQAELALFTLNGGEVLFRQGDAADSVYVLIRGRVRVYVREESGQETTVTELGAGELIGEMAMVTSEARSASVEATRDTQLAKLSRAGFDRFLQKHPRTALEAISRKLAQRLKDTTSGHDSGRKRVSTIAVIPAHPGAPVSQVCEALKGALGELGRALCLSSAAVEERFGRSGISQTYERSGRNIRLTEWLNEQEMAYDYVLYETDSLLSPWTERCIRQADYVLIAAVANTDPVPGDIESELLAPQGSRARNHQWLVLIHGQASPSGTSRWLAQRQAERHFHVRLGQKNDFDRIARYLTGRAVGLTLGGGFARGLAHVGAFQACQELNVQVDAVGGASMGAMIGALWAIGWDGRRIVEEISANCAKPFNDLTFPFIAFKAGKRFSTFVRRAFGDLQIEDLWIPFFCISGNLNRSELKVHTHGSLAKAVLATTRAPGVFPPMVYDGELHIDGGVINNVPVDIMKPFCNQGITVGIDVSPPHELYPVRDYGDDVSGWQVFWKRLSPFVKKHVFTPSILLIMIRTLEFSGISNKTQRLKSADMYIYPDVLKFKRTDFHRADGILAAGYECMRKHLLEWLEHAKPEALRPNLASEVRQSLSAGAGGT
jgi:predicted acylesterase/phospholipase RssA/CRP-like cAMP-binding protein